MNLVIFGPPGAGKGTQSKFIVQKYNLYQLSTGELLRNEIKNKTQLGTDIASIMNSGQLVSDNIAANLIEKSGSWYSYKTQRIGQGRENAKQFMMENPEMANEVEHALRQNAGLFETVMLESNPETANNDSNDASETPEPNSE